MTKDSSNEQLEKKLQEVEQAKSVDLNGKSTSSQAVRLVELFYSKSPTVFHDQFGAGHVRIPSNKGFEILPCESSRFRKYLRRLIWDVEKISMANEVLSQVTSLIASKAEFEGEKAELVTRVGTSAGDFWYDLGHGKSVRIQRGKWSIESETPILFRPQSHQEDQLLPVHGEGDVKRFLKHVRFKDAQRQCLFLVWLISCFIPDISHPVLILFGEKGAAKSTTLRFARRLIDPSKLELLSLPHPCELVQQLSHHYAAFYDNVGSISPSISNSLCRAVTGEGSSKRKLYSNDDDVVYNYRRCIALNGINNPAEAADLLDRSILVESERVPSEERLIEMELEKAFEVDRPYILGGIFDALALARKNIDKVMLDRLPRMADFARWGFAIAEALGYGGHFFLELYNSNIQRQNEEAVEASPVAQVIRRFMEHRNEWEGGSTELYDELHSIVESMKIHKSQWPSQSNVLTRRINEVKSNLLDIGINAQYIREAGRRGWRLSKVTVTTDITVTNRLEVGDGGHDGDGNDDDVFVYDIPIASSIHQVRKRLDDDDDANDGILRAIRSSKVNDFFDERVLLGKLNGSEFVEAAKSIFGPGTKVF